MIHGELFHITPNIICLSMYCIWSGLNCVELELRGTMVIADRDRCELALLTSSLPRGA